MVDVRGDVLRPPHGTTPAAVKSNIKSEMRSFKSNENIHKVCVYPIYMHVCTKYVSELCPHKSSLILLASFPYSEFDFFFKYLKHFSRFSDFVPSGAQVEFCMSASG